MEAQQQQPPPPLPPLDPGRHGRNNNDNSGSIRNNNANVSNSHDHELAVALSMLLSPEELRWAQDIKQAVLADKTLKKLSDFEYAQFAIVTKGDLQDALRRIIGLQHFREEYSISNTLEEAMEIMRAFTKLQPGLILDVTYKPIQLHTTTATNNNDGRNEQAVLTGCDGGHFVLVYDYGVLNPSAIKTDEDWRILLGGVYYLAKLTQANFVSTREGAIHVVETLGMGWNNFSVDMFSRAWHHMYSFLPVNLKRLFYIHSSVIANLLHSFQKSLMGDFARCIQIGCTLDHYGPAEIRLDQLYRLPTPEAADAKLLEKYRAYLEVYFNYEEKVAFPANDDTEGHENEEDAEDEHGNRQENGADEPDDQDENVEGG